MIAFALLSKSFCSESNRSTGKVNIHAQVFVQGAAGAPIFSGNSICPEHLFWITIREFRIRILRQPQPSARAQQLCRRPPRFLADLARTLSPGRPAPKLSPGRPCTQALPCLWPTLHVGFLARAWTALQSQSHIAVMSKGVNGILLQLSFLRLSSMCFRPYSL
jgi:hypothetical protein